MVELMAIAVAFSLQVRICIGNKDCAACHGTGSELQAILKNDGRCETWLASVYFIRRKGRDGFVQTGVDWRIRSRARQKTAAG